MSCTHKMATKSVESRVRVAQCDLIQRDPPRLDANTDMDTKKKNARRRVHGTCWESACRQKELKPVRCVRTDRREKFRMLASHFLLPESLPHAPLIILASACCRHSFCTQSARLGLLCMLSSMCLRIGPNMMSHDPMPQGLSCCTGHTHDATIQSRALLCFAGTSIEMTADPQLHWDSGGSLVVVISYVSKSYFRLFRAARPRDGGAGAGLGGPGREMKPRADA